MQHLQWLAEKRRAEERAAEDAKRQKEEEERKAREDRERQKAEEIAALKERKEKLVIIIFLPLTNETHSITKQYISSGQREKI